MVWLNWQLNQEIRQIEQEIANLNNQQKDLKNLVLYYQSDSFKEIEARRKLGLKKPGEVAIALPNKSYDNYEKELETQKQGVAQKIDSSSTSNHQLWWSYFFK